MKILIIEDDAIKCQSMTRFLQEHIPDAGIETAAAYASGLRKAFRGHFDLIITDNGLPYYENSNDYNPDMAQIVLEELECFCEENRPKCIICSQFDLGTKEAYFSSIVQQYDNCLGFVRYDSSSSDWEGKLLSMIKALSEQETFTNQ